MEGCVHCKVACVESTSETSKSCGGRNDDPTENI